MSAKTAEDRTRLTPYEDAQIQEIAAWKSEPPNPLSELWKKVTRPGARLVEKMIPDAIVRVAIEKTYDVAALTATQEDIRFRAGVDDLAELKHRPLEDCDRLAGQVGANAVMLAAIEGAATGAGGVLTTLADVPLLFALSVRTIIKIGHCYGYTLEGRRGQQYALGVMVTALSGSLQIRRQRLDRLKQVEDLLIEESQEEIITEELTSFLFQLEIFEEVPGVGAISGGILNLSFLRRVEVTARRSFQERWLRDNGKVEAIEPAPVHARHLAPGWSGTLGRVAYAGCYSIGFGAALPVALAAELIRPVGGALSRGIQQGASAVGRGIGRAIPGGWGAAGSSMAEGEAAPYMSPA